MVVLSELVRNKATIPGDVHRIVELGDHSTTMLICCWRRNLTQPLYHCLRMTAATKKDTLLADVPLSDWVFYPVQCMMRGMCGALKIYRSVVLPWVTAGRLAPPLSSIDFSQIYFTSEHHTSLVPMCIVCLSSRGGKDGQGLLPHGCICCDDARCQSPVVGFVWCSFAVWVLGDYLVYDIQHMVGMFVAELHLRESMR